MIDSQNYILSFDLSELSDQMSETKQAYTDLGSAIRSQISGVKGDVASLKDQLGELSTSINNASSVMDTMYDLHRINMKLVVSGLDDFASKIKDINDGISKMSSVDLSKLKDISVPAGIAGGKETAAKRLSDIHPGTTDADEGSGSAMEVANMALAKSNEALKSIKNVLKEYEGARNKIKADEDKKEKGELDNAKDQMKGTLGSMLPPGVLGGGFLGGLLALAVLGVKEDSRKAAERGEMMNIFEASNMNIFDKGTKKMIGFWSDFAENAQRQLGIGRKEVQSLIKQFADAGMAEEELTTKFRSDLGKAGRDVPTMTLALDKMFSLQGGTSAKAATDMVANYGDTLGEAARKYFDLSMAAMTSGMNISKFRDTVLAGSQSLMQYGIDTEDVAKIMKQLHQHYKDMGLDKEYAGEVAARGVAGITSGIAGMSGGLEAVIASRVNPGADMWESLMKYREGFKRTESGERAGHLNKVIKELSEFSKHQVGGSPEKRKYWLMEQGFNMEGAASIVDAMDKFDSGVKVFDDTTKEGKAAIEKFTKVFSTESTQMESFQKAQNKIIDSLAEIGQGILKILSGIFGVIVVGVKSIPVLLEAIANPSRRNELLGKMKDAFSEQFGGMKEGWTNIVKGGTKLKDEVLAKALGEVSGPLSKAIAWDPGIVDTEGGMGKPVKAGVSPEEKAQRAAMIEEETELDTLSGGYGPVRTKEEIEAAVDKRMARKQYSEKILGTILNWIDEKIDEKMNEFRGNMSQGAGAAAGVGAVTGSMNRASGQSGIGAILNKANEYRQGPVVVISKIDSSELAASKHTNESNTSPNPGGN